MTRADADRLPHYPVERNIFNAAAREPSRGKCPICAKDGRWEGDRFVPTNDRQANHPTCYCAAIHKAGADSYDPVTKTMVKRTTP